MGYTALGTQQSHHIPLPSVYGEGGSSPVLVPLHDTVESKSVLDIAPGDYGVMTGYQADEFTLQTECFVVWSQLDPSFTGKVST